MANHLAQLEAQHGHIAAALDAHRSGQLDAEQLQTIASLSAAVKAGATKHREMLAEQSSGLGQALAEQRSGNAVAQHSQLLAPPCCLSEISQPARVFVDWLSCN